MLIRHFIKISHPALANNLSAPALVSLLKSSPHPSSQNKFSTKRKNISASIKQKSRSEESISADSEAKSFSSEVNVEPESVLKAEAKGPQEMETMKTKEKK